MSATPPTTKLEHKPAILVARVRCPICQSDRATIGVLCEGCHAELITGTITITSEQIQSCMAGATPAALVDAWGRLHRLDARAVLGRRIGDGDGLAIVDPSISPHHAELVCDDGAWTLRDLDSAGGTYIDEQRVAGVTPLRSGDRISVGQLSLFFIEDVAQLLAVPALEVQLQEPTGGGGGIVRIDGKGVQVTTPQFELIALLVERMDAERDGPESTRGFVSASELAQRVSLDSTGPRDDHIRQLVRRVRQNFERSGMGDLIESRYNLGYRIRFLPRNGS